MGLIFWFLKFGKWMGPSTFFTFVNTSQKHPQKAPVLDVPYLSMADSSPPHNHTDINTSPLQRSHYTPPLHSHWSIQTMHTPHWPLLRQFRIQYMCSCTRTTTCPGTGRHRTMPCSCQSWPCHRSSHSIQW